MKKRELVYSRRVVNVMKDFVNQASDLTELALSYDGEEKDPTKMFIDNGNWHECEIKTSITIKKIKEINFYADSYNNIIGYNFETLYDNSDLFRKEFIERCPLARGFADITLALLHELGHLETVDSVSENFDRVKQISDNYFLAIEIIKETEELSTAQELINYLNNTQNKKKIKGLNSHLYHLMEDEWLATQWAIDWLQNAENRKLAKAFEKKFFACFK